MRTLPALATAIALLAPTAAAQFTTFTLTSNCRNNGSYSLTGVPSSTSSTTGSGVLRATGATGTDHLYQDWWYYRLAGDPQEYAFHTGSGSGYLQLPVQPRPNQRVLLWSNVDNRGFSASLSYEMVSTGASRGLLIQTMRASNLGTTPLTLNLFHYLDLDYCGTTSNSAQFATGGPRQIQITSSCGSAYYLGCNADNWEVAAFSGLRGRLLDASVNDLANTGIPFASGDWTGAWQWKDRVIPPSGSLTVTVSIGVDFQIWTCGTATNTSYCSGKAGTNGVPFWSSDRALFGGAVELSVTNGLPNAVPVVLFGVGQLCNAVPPFGTLAANQIFAFPLAAFDASRVARGCVTIPDDPSMLGFAFVNQAWFADPGAAGHPVAHTDGLELKLGSH